MITIDHMVNEEVFNKNRSYADMNHTILLIQYLLMVDQSSSLRYILKSHLMYDFLAHIDYRFVRETVIGLLTPGDPLFKLNDNICGIMLDYISISGWDRLVVKQMNNMDIEEIYNEKKSAKINPQLNEFLQSLPTDLSEDHLIKSSNPFQLLFNTLIIIKSKIFLRQQLSDQSNLPNIDAIPKDLLPKAFYRMPSLSRGISLLDMGLNEFADDSRAKSPKRIHKEAVRHSKTNLLFKAKPSSNDKPNKNGGSPIGKIKKILSNQKFGRVFTNIFKPNKFNASNTNLSSGLPQLKEKLYPEKVETFNIAILEKKRIFKENFEYHLKKEKHLMNLLDLIINLIEKPIFDAQNDKLVRFLKQKKGDLNLLRKTTFLSLGFYDQVAISFIVRLDYKAVNDMDTDSIYSSGKILILFLKNWYNSITKGK